MSNTYGSDLLYKAATGMERAAADTDADRLIAINAELIRDIWDAEKCPADLLLYLAWAMGVEFWNDEWSETTKRTWVSIQWIFKSQRGTAQALRTAVRFAGRDISRWGHQVGDITVRPQQVFSGPSLTKAEREAWLTKMPQVRSWRIRDTTEASEFKSFYNASNSLRLHSRRFCLGGASSPNDEIGVAPIPSTAIQRLKRRVRWVENGVETDTTVTEFGSYFRVHRESIEDSKVFCHRPFGLGRYFIPSDAWKRLLTVQPQTQLPWRSPIAPTLQAITSEPERIVVSHTPESGSKNYNVFCNMPVWEKYFIPTTAPYRIYQRFAVLDPNIRALRRTPVQFMGTGRYSFPKFTAWAEVFIGNKQNQWAAGVGYFVPKTKFYIPHDPEPVRRVRAAAIAAKSLRDKILLQIGPKPRFLAAGTPVLADVDEIIVGRP